jgi:ABC-2 type transport system permease protein
MTSLAPPTTLGSAARTRDLVLDSLALARRNIEHVRQIPEKLLDVTLQPIMFVLLFAYVFGGVIHVPGGSYREYIIGGVLVQTLAFGIMGPATSIATDLTEGIVDRFRSLPMARSAYLIGHLLAEMAAISVGIVVLCLSGLIVGWRIHTDLPHALAGFALLLLFAFAMLIVGTLLGILVRSPDAAQGVVFIAVFPLTFLANTFVPLDGLPSVLRSFAQYNPISAVAAACRTLFGNPVALPAHPSWPLEHPVLSAFCWCVAIIAVAGPLMIMRYGQRTTG